MKRFRCGMILWLIAVFLLGLATTGLCAEVPTIDQLTGGKVKNGDLITKENVETVKEWLAPSTYEQVKRGMVLVMAPNTAVEATLPAYYLDATKKNAGKAVMGKNSVPYTKDGKKWLGGFPFPDPQSGEEAMANQKFGLLFGADDFNYYVKLDYVNKTGKSYKYSISWYRKLWVNPRLKMSPTPTFPGHGDELFRSMIVFTEPYDLKSISQVVTRYYDDTAKPDDGYVYIPALKRTRRISATNWQDNMGGSDLTWGDAEGFVEPFSLWTFKLLEKKNMLMPGQSNPVPTKSKDGKIVPGVPLDGGEKWARMQWEVRPVVVVEAKPKGTHIYGKQILYLDGLNWRSAVVDKFDKQGKLWKAWTCGGGLSKGKDGNNYGITYYPHGYDVQLDQMTRMTTITPELNTGVSIDQYSTKKMLEMGQ